MSLPEPTFDDSHVLAQADLAEVLERHIASGFHPGLALDLVLNELVVRAADATRARSAALALCRNDEMVCRAATGEHAPDLGIPIDTRDGLSGSCLRTRQSQICFDTETDPRVDAAACRRLGVRSMLIVPVMEGEELAGVLEVFATDPGEFVDSDQNLLEIFAREAARIRMAALEREQRQLRPDPIATEPQPVPIKSRTADRGKPLRYQVWTFILGGVAIILAVAISFLIGARIGWLRGTSPSRNPHSLPVAQGEPIPTPRKQPARNPANTAVATDSTPPLVVYERGRVVFRMKPSAPSHKNVPLSAPAANGPIARVWLAPASAERQLRHRAEPQYPAEAQAAHRTGEVQLEVVVGADGTVSSAHATAGDPTLAAAASDAVRAWRYEPYRVQGRPTEFQTDVTLKFSLPD
jgi:TonB family protein